MPGSAGGGGLPSPWEWVDPVYDAGAAFRQLGEGGGFVLRRGEKATPVSLLSPAIPVVPFRRYTVILDLQRAPESPVSVFVRALQGRSSDPQPEEPHFQKSWTLSDTTQTTIELPVIIREKNTTLRLEIGLAGDAVGEVAVSGIRLAGGDYRPVHLPPDAPPDFSGVYATEVAAARSPVTLKVEKQNGIAALMLNGAPAAPIFYNSPLSSLPTNGSNHAFGKAGVRFHVRPVLGEGIVELRGKTVWQGPGKYDFQHIDEQIEKVLREAPGAFIILNLMADPYADWGNDKPDEIVQNQLGEPGIGGAHLRRWGGGAPDPAKERFLPSIHSKLLREDMKTYLAAVVRHVENSPYRNVVVGYGIQGMNDMQFVPWAHWQKEKLDDYSPAAVAAFREWLVKRYENDVDRLRAAWGRDDVTFETAAIPAAERRRADGLFLDWKADADLADFHRFYAEAPIELMDDLARAVKEASGGGKTVQVYHAGGMTSGPAAAQLGRLLESRWIDLTQAPADYWVRLPGQPGGLQATWGSLLLHGKLFLTEQDWRSVRNPSRGWETDFSVGRAESAPGTAEMIRRETGMVLARGQGTWFLDLEKGAFDDSTIMRAVTEAQKAGDALAANPSLPPADVGVFYSERSFDYLTNPGANPYRWFVLRRGRPDWDTSGVPYHIFLQSDLANPSLPDLKVCVFAMAQAISPAERAAIEERKSGGRTLVFFHAPGWVGAEDPAAAISEVTGIHVRALGERPLEGEWAAGDSPLLKGLRGTFGDRGVSGTYPADAVSGPAFAVDDPDAVPLAYYKGTKDVAIAAKQHDGWLAIYCGVPKMPAQFFHNVAAVSGAWCAAAPHDAAFVSDRIATLHAILPGKKQIRLRQPARVTDLHSDGLVSESAAVIEFEAEPGETRWFLLDPPTATSKSEAP